MTQPIDQDHRVLITDVGKTKCLWWCVGCEAYHAVSIAPHRNEAGASWAWNGDEVAPTFSPSVLCRGDVLAGIPTCHCYVQGGLLHFLPDCTHPLAGHVQRMVANAFDAFRVSGNRKMPVTS